MANAAKRVEAVPAQERMRFGLCLVFVGGFLESYTYLLHGHVFANAQTGNLALMMLYAANADAHAWYYLVPVGAFLAGVFASEWMRAAMSTRRRASWYHALLAAEAAVLAGIAFLPAGVPDAVVIVLVSFCVFSSV